MIPAADMILSTSMLITRNIYGKTVGKDTSVEHQRTFVRCTVFGLTAVALILAIYLPNMLVNLLLTGYSGVTQFFPMIVGGLFWRKITLPGAFSGLLVGEILVFTMIIGKMDPWAVAGLNLNAGFVALVANLIVCAVVSLMTYNEEKAAKRQIALAKA